MDINKQINKIFRETKKNMEIVNTYQKEFDAPIKRYAEMRVQFDILNQQWRDGGCKITEDYTNKGGATNERKTALYLSLETLRKELIDMENIFGLTPKGLKAIKSKAMNTKAASKLDKVLGSLGG